MDSGCLEPGESLDEDFDMSTDLSPAELIWLMDELMNREVAWLMGYPLSQTLFTSIHIDRLLWPAPVELSEATFIRISSPQMTPTQSALRAYCLLLIKSCDLVLELVTSQHYYEEEDITTELFNRELCHRFAVDDILEIGRCSIEYVADTFNQDALNAIKPRLTFRCDVLRLLDMQNAGVSPPPADYAELADSVKTLEATHAIGKPFPAAFSTKIQRRLASTVPPRPMVTVSMSDAWSFWRKMLTDCKHVWAVFETTHSHDLLTAYQLFAYNDPQLSIYPRALLQYFLTGQGTVTDRVTVRQFVKEDVLTLTLAASPILQQNTPQALTDTPSYFGEFVNRFEQSFINIYRALCLNSCRIRRSFCHALVEWDNLQIDIEDLDTVIHRELGMRSVSVVGDDRLPFSLSSWVYHHKLCLLEQTILMGFHQMIYAPQELAGMYWYLSYISEEHLQHLERITAFTVDRSNHVDNEQVIEGEEQQKQRRTAVDRQFRLFAFTRATNLLARAIHGIFVLLQRHGIFRRNGPVYSEDRLRYEIRMKPFSNLTIPEPFSVETFNEAAELRHSTTKQLLAQANRSATEARKAWDEIGKLTWNLFPSANASDSILQEKWVEDVRNCVKASISATLRFSTLTKGLEKPEWIDEAKRTASIPAMGSKARRHRWWIVPELPPV